MKVSLKGLPNKLRGVAWPSSARTLRRALKCVNERDPYHHLLLRFFKLYDLNECKHYDGTAADKAEEGMGDGRSVWPESLGLHAVYNG